VSSRALQIAARVFQASGVVALALSSCAAAQQPDANAIIQKMVQAQAENRERLKAYMLTRTYQVYNSDEKQPKSTITAEVSYVPPQQKEFTIQQSSGGMAESVVRKALEHEVKMTKQPRVGEIGPENYDFEYVGTQAIWGKQCHVFNLHPKRESKELLNGRVWIDANRFLIRRVEGEPAKDPSWWVNNIRVTVTYDEVAGMWMQTGTDASAHVRLAGNYRMVSKDNEVRTAESVAQAGKSDSLKRMRRALVPAVAMAR
jgi:outer membrane lipoprotein-sorting protein